MKLTQEEYEAIEDLAACNFAPRKIATYLDVDKSAFMSAWFDKTSLVRYHYERGRIVSDFEIARKRYENAKNGNLTADQQHSKENEARRVEDLKLEILYSGNSIMLDE